MDAPNRQLQHRPPPGLELVCEAERMTDREQTRRDDDYAGYGETLEDQTQEIERLKAELEQAKRERDTLVEALRRIERRIPEPTLSETQRNQIRRDIARDALATLEQE